MGFVDAVPDANPDRVGTGEMLPAGPADEGVAPRLLPLSEPNARSAPFPSRSPPPPAFPGPLPDPPPTPTLSPSLSLSISSRLSLFTSRSRSNVKTNFSQMPCSCAIFFFALASPAPASSSILAAAITMSVSPRVRISPLDSTLSLRRRLPWDLDTDVSLLSLVPTNPVGSSILGTGGSDVLFLKVLSFSDK